MTLSTISAHGRALKLALQEPLVTLSRTLSTISAHGRALKQLLLIARQFGMVPLSTISAHGRALKRGGPHPLGSYGKPFQQFRLTVEH